MRCMHLFNFIRIEIRKIYSYKKVMYAFLALSALFIVVLSNFFDSLSFLFERWYQKTQDQAYNDTFFTFFSANLSYRVSFVVLLSVCTHVFLVEEIEKKSVWMRQIFLLPPQNTASYFSKWIICHFLLIGQFITFAFIFYLFYTFGIDKYLQKELIALSFNQIGLHFGFFCFLKMLAFSSFIKIGLTWFKSTQIYTVLIYVVLGYVMSAIKYSPSNSLVSYRLFSANNALEIDVLVALLWLLVSYLIFSKSRFIRYDA